MTVVNDYRRRGYAEIAQESWVQESDGQTVTTGTPVPGSPQWLEPHQRRRLRRAERHRGHLQRHLRCGHLRLRARRGWHVHLPHAERSPPAPPTPSPPWGPGTEFGDLASLTLEQREQALYVNGYSLVADVIIPAMMNVIVPINNAGGTGEAWMRFLRTPDAMSILEDMANVLLAEPEVANDLAEGEYVQALSRSWEDRCTGRCLPDAGHELL